MIDPIDFARLRRIGLSQALLQRALQLDPLTDGAALLRVAEVQRDALTLHDGRAELAARVMPALLGALALDDQALAVGDWVLARADAHARWWVHERVSPLTQISRRLHDGRDKVTRAVIVANVDLALLVMGLDHDFNARRLERYLVLARLAGVQPLVVLTKADTCGDRLDAHLADARALLPAGAALVAVNALDPDCRRQFVPWLDAGRTLVLLGSSGTGKSTLTNRLVEREAQATGAIRKGDGRGRHTTSARSLLLTPEGACIVDTPGLRTLRLDGDAFSIGAAFDDIAALAPGCRFRDCRHEGEPGCAVRDAVGAERLRNYGKLQREAQRDTMTALQRKAQLASWKQRSKVARAVLRAKRG